MEITIRGLKKLIKNEEVKILSSVFHTIKIKGDHWRMQSCLENAIHITTGTIGQFKQVKDAGLDGIEYEDKNLQVIFVERSKK